MKYFFNFKLECADCDSRTSIVMAPSKKKPTAADPTPASSQAGEDISMTDDGPTAPLEEAPQDEDHDPALLAFGEQRIRLVRGNLCMPIKKDTWLEMGDIRYIC